MDETIHEFTPFNTASLSIDLHKAMQEAVGKYGLTAKAERSKFSPQVMNITFEFTAKDLNGKEGKQAEFEKYASMVGLLPEHYGATIRIGTGYYTVVGLRPNAHKNKVQIKSARGKVYVTSPWTVKNNLVK